MTKRNLVSSLREAKIHSPTDFTFDETIWLAEASSHADGSEFDAFLLAITPRFAETFRWLRGLLDGVVKTSASVETRVLALAAITNRECVLAGQKASSAATSTTQRGGEVSMDHLAVQRINLDGGAFSADEIAQTTIDMAEAMLRMLAHFPTEEGASDDMTVSDMAHDVRVGSAYAMVEHLWLDVLWNECVLVPSSQPATFVARDVEQQKCRAVMWHRYHMLGSQGYLIAFHAARQLGQQRDGDALPKLRVDRSAMLGTFVLERAPSELVADQMARRFASVPEYYEPYLTMQSPSDAQLTLGLVIEAYLLLGGALRDEWEQVEETLGMETEDGSADLPLGSYAPVLSRQSLVAAFEQGLGISPLSARSVFEFFAFNLLSGRAGAKKDIWSAPCVVLGGDRFAFVLHSFHNGNASWLVDVWLRRLGFALDDRGTRFEAYVRAHLGRVASRSPLKSVSTVHPHALKFEGEEIDCVFRVGGTVVLAEVKCFLLPVSPVDKHNHERKVREAAEQIKRKHAAVAKRLDSFRKRAQKCGLDLPDSLEVKSVIILSNAIGAGQIIDGVPAVDLLIVERFFHGTLERLASIGPEGVLAKHVVRFWASPEQADGALSKYLLNPPQVTPMLASIVERDLKVPMLGFPDDTVYSKHYEVDPDALLAFATKEAEDGA